MNRIRPLWPLISLKCFRRQPHATLDYDRRRRSFAAMFPTAMYSSVTKGSCRSIPVTASKRMRRECFGSHRTRGLIRFDAANRSYFVFTTDDGLLTINSIIRRSVRAQRAVSMPASNDGFISFAPAELQPHDEASPIVLTDFMLYNQSVSVDSDSSPLKRSITPTRPSSSCFG